MCDIFRRREQILVTGVERGVGDEGSVLKSKPLYISGTVREGVHQISDAYRISHVPTLIPRCFSVGVVRSIDYDLFLRRVSWGRPLLRPQPGSSTAPEVWKSFRLGG
jgi:hypothetical protein